MEGAIRSGNLAAAEVTRSIYGQAFNESNYWKYIKNQKDAALKQLRATEDLAEEALTVMDVVARFFKVALPHIHPYTHIRHQLWMDG